MVRLAYASIIALIGAAYAQSQSGATSSFPTITQPTTINNGQSACVQYGDCTTLPSSNTYKTETQYSPITSPASTSVPHLSNAEQSQSYIGSFAAQGASQAYATGPKPQATTAVPPKTTVTYAHETVINGRTTTQVEVNQNDAAFVNHMPNMMVVYTFAVTAIASVAGTLFL
ncbi:hypothetical protein MCUN1_003851 [Malassezia cuniculi]|uniref:Uncharacterized protein n=1 Tax=Malassezia cuniculi TaxID=948313 RepID=A0AAF0J8K8_9BASI|nr:hypothetical protein MCUN1_003851 [Malassezia cuniculi]